MAKQLTIDEMMECAKDAGMPGADAFIRGFENMATALAQSLAHHLHVTCGDASFQGTALAGTCAPFMPRKPGQPCPEPLAQYDESEWDDNEESDD